MYKFVTKEQYENEGWKESHPKARYSSDGKEYVLSNAGPLSKDEALEHIKLKWPDEKLT